MKSSQSDIRVYRFIGLLLLLPILSGYLLAQSSSGTLQGRVTDPSGAVVPQAIVSATGANGQTITAVTNNQGAYEIKGLPAGNYTVNATAKGFSLYTAQGVAIVAGQALHFDVALEIAVQPEKVEVEEQGMHVTVSPSENATSVVIKEKDLEALSDDPDELQSELEALAGPSAGPNGGQVYIDGFTAGQLPPKESIREIRINQNPFSAQYDKLGYGRIEIFTKPGTDQYHGQLLVDGNYSAFNSLNPLVSEVPSYHSVFFMGSVGGPLSKRASFFIDGMRRDINDSNIVDATVLGPAPGFAPTPFSQAITNPRTRTNLGPRIDYQVSKNNTLTVRYQFFENNENNEGVGQFSLPAQAYNFTQTEHTLQISDTQVLSTNVINETRFQYLRDSSGQTVLGLQPAISVLGAFIDGGNQQGNGSDLQNHYELQNYTSMVHGRHFIRFGGRLRGLTDSNTSNAGFNGLFTFSSIGAYQITQQGLYNKLTMAQIRALGGGPSQFSILAGEPLAQVTLLDAGLYGEDDWRIRPNITLSYGLRFETQNQIHDHGDFAPRLAFAWGLGRGKNPSPSTVLRAGFGMFYDRFASNFVLQAERLNANGLGQRQYIVPNPQQFYQTLTASEIAGLIASSTTSPTYYQIAPNLRAPYTMQTAVSIERQVTKKATVALTYLNAIGEHQLFIRNSNAPLPGCDPQDPTTCVRPLSNLYGDDNVYQYDSEGVFRQNQLIANFRVSAGSKLSLFGYYTLNYANSDLGVAAGGSGGPTGANFLSNQYDPMADYGRSLFDVRHRVFLGGTVSLPYAFRLNPLIVVSSGQPFDITVGQDLNGDSIFNDRPGFVSTAACTSVTPMSGNLCTPLGTFNPTPAPGQAVVPINTGTGPTLFTFNFRVSKTFGFGRETKGSSGGGPGGYGGGGRGGGGPGGGLGGRGLSGGGGPGGGGPFGMGNSTNRRYNLTFSVSARNLLNRVNLATPIGNLSSPLFDQSNALAGGPYSFGSANRRIDLQVMFSF